MSLPAALENQLTRENAPRIKAKILLEGVNGPTTPKAEGTFQEKGMPVIPDVYAKAGGVTVSYFEWLKNFSHVRFGRMEKRYEEAAYRRMLKAVELSTDHRFTEAEPDLITRGANELDIVNSGLEETMAAAYHEILETRRQYRGYETCVPPRSLTPSRKPPERTWNSASFPDHYHSHTIFLGKSQWPGSILAKHFVQSARKQKPSQTSCNHRRNEGAKLSDSLEPRRPVFQYILQGSLPLRTNSTALRVASSTANTSIPSTASDLTP
jgi:hypothetical protein